MRTGALYQPQSFGFRSGIAETEGGVKSRPKLASSGGLRLPATSVAQGFDLHPSRLNWKGGWLEDVREELPTDAPGPRVRMPADRFVKLVLGYRSLSELLGESLDVAANRAGVSLVDVLFPPLQVWVEF